MGVGCKKRRNISGYVSAGLSIEFESGHIYEDYGDKRMWHRKKNGEEMKKLRKESIREE